MGDVQISDSTVTELADFERLTPLDAGEPVIALRPKLDQLTPENLAGTQKAASLDMARACIGALWLHYNFLEEAHQIFQSLPDDAGSYWHGIMHRREPDASNAAYWMRRVGRHPIFADLQQGARELLSSNAHDSRAEFLARQEAWNPISFIDLCETYRNTNSATERLCQRVQLLEWRLLFEFCRQRATGT